MRETLTFHIEASLEEGYPIPEPRMSLEDAIAYHSQVLADHRKETPTDDDEPSTMSTTFAPIEVEVATLQGVAGT